MTLFNGKLEIAKQVPFRLTEKDLTRQIRDLLRALHIFHYKAWQGLMSEKGISDIIGCYKGRFFAIEAKVGKDQLSQKQAEFLDNSKAAGGIGFEARSIEDVVQYLGLQDRVKLW